MPDPGFDQFGGVSSVLHDFCTGLPAVFSIGGKGPGALDLYYIDLLRQFFWVLALVLIIAAMACIAAWTSRRIKDALPRNERPWVGVGLSFLITTGFIAICSALHQKELKLEAIALFILVPHLIIVAWGDHKFFDEAKHDRPHDPHTG